MRIILERNADRMGCSDEWAARLADVPEGARPGIGKNRSEALGSLLGANLGLFGITERVDINPRSETPVCIWTATPAHQSETPSLTTA